MLLYDENINDFFRMLGCKTDTRTDKQLLFIYLLKTEVRKEIDILRAEKNRDKKFDEVIRFEISDDEDEGPGEN